ncbi:MAG TPA: Gfo/Idh/MocA family oxidoreductase [Acidobacteriaceae bacterium]|nr:Gfo/Idh/MocA family oxidoreductase [Acidobacteriaceae bacterium]
MSRQDPIRVAVVGTGFFGYHHLRVYRALEKECNVLPVAAVDGNPITAKAIAAEYGIPTFTSIEDMLAANLGVQAASLCVPTLHHARLGQQLLSAGIDLLVEKPIASSLEEADALVAAAAANCRILQVGHLERFNVSVMAVVPHLHQPMFFEAHRLSIFGTRSLDVDVVLDLMIHDLDIVLDFVQSPVVEVRAVGLPVLSNKIDIANVRVEFANGCIANFTASRVSTEKVRKLRFFQPRQYLSIDLARQELMIINVAGAAAFSPAPAPGPAMGPTPGPAPASTPSAALAAAELAAHPSAGLSILKVPVEPKEPLFLELASFIDSVRTRKAPVVTGEQARTVLALALDINRKIAEHSIHAGLDRFISEN